MAKTTGFIEVERVLPRKRSAEERVRDWGEYERALGRDELQAQASRCMNCGVPFCHNGCPLGNVMPEWNDAVYRGRWDDAERALHATNNFPEFTGRVCPAPCEEACVLNLAQSPVTIRHIEEQIVDRAFAEGRVRPVIARQRTGKHVAIVGSGPAGLACAQQLARAGHEVTVFERSDRIGGLLRYGVPDFKLEKWQIDRRVEQMVAEGVRFRTSVAVGRDVTARALRTDYDAVVLAIGAGRPRDLDVPGRDLAGVHRAMAYLEQANRAVAGSAVDGMISARGKRVVVLGGGDTGADCVGTAHRQGAASVLQLELLPRPPEARTADMPWPRWPGILRTAGAHEEGGTREWSVSTRAFEGDADGKVRAVVGMRVDWTARADGTRAMVDCKGGEVRWDAELVLLALGFTGVETASWIHELGASVTAAGVIDADARGRTGVPGVFACGDSRRGASLVVWAIAEGRETAATVDAWLASRVGALAAESAR